MAVTNRQIIDYLLANPNLSDAQIVSAMEQNGISPSQMASAVNLPEGQIATRVAATVPNGQTVTLGDTVIQPVYQVSGSGMDQQIGGLENVITYKAVDNKAGGAYTQYTPTGEVEQTGTQQEVKSGLKEFALGAGLLFGLPTLLNAGATGALATEGLTLGELGLGSELGAVTNVADVVAGTQGGLLTGGAEAATAFELANAGIAGGAATFTPAQLALIEAGASAAEVAAAGAGGATGLLTTPATTGALTTGGTGALTTAGGALTTAGGTGALTTAGGAGGLLSTGLPAAGTVGGALATGALSTLGSAAATGLLGNAITGGLGLAGGVLQSQESRDAATAAAANVNTATQQAVAGSQFRPVGMTTRFGTSNYTYDPVTGRMTSAGYQLSPEAKAAQDRLVGLAGRGLTQAEQAQQQFAPLQTGAQNLFGLGNQYISQSPQDVAQNYINQQMALLQPSREVELANLQNRLQQQGRAGLSVAQGGSLGATTPELQALYNARAQQELQLAANAQQAGQQNVLFGAGLLGQGSQAMGQYYGGQQAAYAPYTAALGQVQNLESLAQQPLQMGASLGQQSATAGANAGRIGLTGAQISGNLMTSPAVTNNPYAAFLSGLGSPTSTLGQGLANYFTGYNQNVPPVTAMSAPSTGYGAGNYYGNQDVLGLWGI